MMAKHYRQLYGPEPPADFFGDGCTGAPDLQYRRACRMHDWHYRCGTNRLDRRLADDLLWINLRQLGASAVLAFVYWLAVRIAGGRHFRRSAP